MSQGCCASRPTIYDQVQTQCCQFLKFLIKKDVFFTKGCLCSFATRAFLFTIGKTTIGKVKTKKKRAYVQIQKVKTKNYK